MSAERDPTLINAIAVSAILHGALLTPWPGWDVAQREAAARPVLEVQYLASPLAAPAPAVEAVARAALPAAPPPAHLLDRAPASADAGVPDVPQFDASPLVQPAPVLSTHAPPPIPRSLRTNPSYLSYYQIIRERIRKVANRNRPSPFERGQVGLWFVVEARGVLEQVGTVPGGSANPRLQRVAVAAVQEAAPFPPFPSSLPHRAIPFQVVISFEPGPAGR